MDSGTIPGLCLCCFVAFFIFYVAGFCISVELLLRRTLQRSVILLVLFVPPTSSKVLTISVVNPVTLVEISK